MKIKLKQLTEYVVVILVEMVLFGIAIGILYKSYIS